MSLFIKSTLNQGDDDGKLVPEGKIRHRGAENTEGAMPPRASHFNRIKEGGYFKAEEVFGAELIRPSGRAGVRYKSLPEFSRNRKTLILGKGRFRVGRMKSKQLANVLIKIIGLYTCLCAIPSLVVGIAGAIVAASGATKSNDLLSYTSPNAIGAAIQFVVGIFLIGKSRKLAEYWFKNEDEQSHSEPLKEN